jgi:MFS transporter, PPP family, 3-phenylpropionic acid transporter
LAALFKKCWFQRRKNRAPPCHSPDNQGPGTQYLELVRRFHGSSPAYCSIRFVAGLICFTGVLIDQSFGWLVIVMASYSFFWNAVLPQHEVITLNFLGNQPERYSRLRLWGSIGFIVFVVAAGLLFERVGIEVFPWLGIVCMASIFISSLHIPVPLNEGARIKRGSLWSSARQSAVLSFLLAGTLLQVAHGAYYSFFSIYMAELGYTSFAIGMLWSLGVIAEVVIFIFMHNLLLSVGIRTVLITSLLFAVLRWILIAKGAHIVWLLVFAQCLHAFTFGTFHAAAIDTIRRLFKPESQGGGQALYSAVSLGIGGAVGSCLAGLYWQEGAEFVFIVASALCGAAVVIAWFGFRDTRLA